jgi:tetratricopeptide (TPR) repeat protein
MKLFAALCAGVCLCIPAVGDTFVVLPFVNASHSENLDWIGESVSESIREALASEGVMTLERDDRQEAYRRLGLRTGAQLTRASVVKIGQALDADQVVFGDFYFTPAAQGSAGSRGSLNIRARILDLRHLRQGPEFSEIGPLEDLAKEQSRLAWQTLKFIKKDEVPSEAEFQRQYPPVRVDAMENYIRGLLASPPDQKLKLLSQAVRLAPGFSPALFELGMLVYSRHDFKTAADWLAKVDPGDPKYRQANFFLGICRFELGDYAAAESAFALVAKTVPLNEVLNNLGAAESRLNKREAADNLAKALEGDPSDPTYHFNVGYALWKQGDFEAAAERFRAVLDRDPNDAVATTLLGRCLKHSPPQNSDRMEPLERIKTTFEESAYWQLKALLQPQKR